MAGVRGRRAPGGCATALVLRITSLEDRFSRDRDSAWGWPGEITAWQRLGQIHLPGHMGPGGFSQRGSIVITCTALSLPTTAIFPHRTGTAASCILTWPTSSPAPVSLPLPSAGFPSN